MSLWCNVNTSTGHNESGQPSECSCSHSSQSAGRRISGTERNQSEATAPLRLPQIRVPPHFEFQRRQNPSPLSTCPSLHQHHHRKDEPSTQSILRKFFAKHDDVSEPSNETRPYRGPASPPQIPSDKISSNELMPNRRQENQPHQFSHSHSHQSYQPNVVQPREIGRSTLAFREEARTFSPSVSGSNSTSEHTHEDDRFWENVRQPGSSFTHNSSGLETSASNSGFEDGGSSQGELYRCSDCNRKCKSKASYLKHRSMMCTHRLGPLTLECRYCKRHYTYAGYLQRHELECAKAHHQ